VGDFGTGGFGIDIGFEHEEELQVCATPEEVAIAAADLVAACAAEAIAARGRFTLALSGGSTPRPLFALLATPSWRTRIQWARVDVVWSDERAVPPDHADSNYRVAREALLDHVPVPAAQIHRIHGEDDPEAAASAYEQTLREVAADGLDLVLLGLGRDGHTASLFPNRPAGRETTRWVVADQDPGGRARLTLTPPAINAARTVAVIVTGADKALALQAVREGPVAPDLLPAQRIGPPQGRLVWIVDHAALTPVGPGTPPRPS
jgi:6-phosphogluconolactonase